MSNTTQSSQYNETFITALQWMWGDGYLAPGGPEEVAELLKPIDISGKKVLDIGSGLGAIAMLLVEEHGAASVHGIDVEPHLIEHSRNRISHAGLADRISFELVEPGPLKFENNSFEVVFTKDAIVHIRDKKSFYQEVLRVLKPAGAFIGSDWLRGGQGAYSELAEQWLEFVHLDYQMKNLDETRVALEGAGFANVSLNDRNAWYREEIKAEMASLQGDQFAELVRRIGQEEADYRLQSSALKQKVIEEGFLRPTHFVGLKPD